MKRQHQHWTEALRSLAQDKAVREVLAEAEQQGGWTGRLTGKSHIVLRHRSGATTTLPGTPGDSHGRSIANAKAAIRRISRH